jgi:hypothetical protein
MKVAECVVEVQIQAILRLNGRNQGVILSYVERYDLGLGKVEERREDSCGACATRENRM